MYRNVVMLVFFVHLVTSSPFSSFALINAGHIKMLRGSTVAAMPVSLCRCVNFK